jgi:hypothetical protein
MVEAKYLLKIKNASQKTLTNVFVSEVKNCPPQAVALVMAMKQ